MSCTPINTPITTLASVTGECSLNNHHPSETTSAESSHITTPTTTTASSTNGNEAYFQPAAPVQPQPPVMDIVGLRTQIIANWAVAHPGHINPAIVIHNHCKSCAWYSGAIMTQPGSQHPCRPEMFHKTTTLGRTPEDAMRILYLDTCRELSWIGMIHGLDLCQDEENHPQT